MGPDSHPVRATDSTGHNHDRFRDNLSPTIPGEGPVRRQRGRAWARCCSPTAPLLYSMSWRSADSIATRIINADGRAGAALSVLVRSGPVSLTAAVPTIATPT